MLVAEDLHQIPLSLPRDHLSIHGLGHSVFPLGLWKVPFQVPRHKEESIKIPFIFTACEIFYIQGEEDNSM